MALTPGDIRGAGENHKAADERKPTWHFGKQHETERGSPDQLKEVDWHDHIGIRDP